MLYVKTAVCHQPGHPGLPSQVALLESEQDPGRRGTCVPPLTPRLAGHRGARVHRWALSGWALEAPLSGELWVPLWVPLWAPRSRAGFPPPACVLPRGPSQAPRGQEPQCGGHPVLWDSVPETSAWLCLTSRPCPVGLPRGSRPGLWTRVRLPEAGPSWAGSWTGPSCKCRP